MISGFLARRLVDVPTITRRQAWLSLKKATAVADIAEKFKEATATVVTEYRGLTVSNLAELRRSLGAGTSYTVAKNTLVKRAASEAGVEGLDELFAGPTAIAFIQGEPVDAAKAIKKFAKEKNKALVIKGGYMDGRALTVSEVERIADLESREVLLSKLAGAMKAKQSQAAALFVRPRPRSHAWPQLCKRRRLQRFRRTRCLTQTTTKHTDKESPWQSCPPTNCSTRSRK